MSRDGAGEGRGQEWVVRAEGIGRDRTKEESFERLSCYVHFILIKVLHVSNTCVYYKLKIKELNYSCKYTNMKRSQQMLEFT